MIRSSMESYDTERAIEESKNFRFSKKANSNSIPNLKTIFVPMTAMFLDGCFSKTLD